MRTPGGKRLYAINEFVGRQGESPKEPQKEDVCYCRVSSTGQKEDLQRQVAYMQERFPGHRIITDIGSGINFKRKGLRTLLELAFKGHLREVVVCYRDRLCRVAWELFEWILCTHGVKLVVLNQAVEGSSNTELAEDLLAIIQVFNSRVNGRRKYGGGKKADQSRQEQEATTEPVPQVPTES